MSLVRKTLVAAAVSGITLAGAVGTANAAVAPKPVVKNFHVYSPTKTKWTSKAEGWVKFSAKSTSVTGIATNKSKTAVTLVVVIYKDKAVIGTKTVIVKGAVKTSHGLVPSHAGVTKLVQQPATKVTVKIGTGAPQVLTPKKH
jgi:hypothetical protein